MVYKLTVGENMFEEEEKYQRIRIILDRIFSSAHAYKVLRIIYKKGEVTPPDVTKEIKATDAGVRKTIKQLAEYGFIEETIYKKKQGRSAWYVLKLTDAGVKIVEFIEKIVEEFPEELLKLMEEKRK